VVRSCCAVFLCTRDGKAEGTIILIERGKLRSHGNGGTQKRRWVQLFECLPYLKSFKSALFVILGQPQARFDTKKWSAITVA